MSKTRKYVLSAFALLVAGCVVALSLMDQVWREVWDDGAIGMVAGLLSAPVEWNLLTFVTIAAVLAAFTLADGVPPVHPVRQVGKRVLAAAGAAVVIPSAALVGAAWGPVAAVPAGVIAAVLLTALLVSAGSHGWRYALHTGALFALIAGTAGVALAAANSFDQKMQRADDLAFTQQWLEDLNGFVEAGGTIYTFDGVDPTDPYSVPIHSVPSYLADVDPPANQTVTAFSPPEVTFSGMAASITQGIRETTDDHRSQPEDDARGTCTTAETRTWGVPVGDEEAAVIDGGTEDAISTRQVCATVPGHEAKVIIGTTGSVYLRGNLDEDSWVDIRFQSMDDSLSGEMTAAEVRAQVRVAREVLDSLVPLDISGWDAKSLDAALNR